MGVVGSRETAKKTPTHWNTLVISIVSNFHIFHGKKFKVIWIFQIIKNVRVGECVVGGKSQEKELCKYVIKFKSYHRKTLKVICSEDAWAPWTKTKPNNTKIIFYSLKLHIVRDIF